MLSPDIQNLHAPEGAVRRERKNLGRVSTEHASETAALAHGSPSRTGVPSGLVAEVRPQPAAELFPLRFDVIEEQFPVEVKMRPKRKSCPPMMRVGRHLTDGNKRFLRKVSAFPNTSCQA
ncbi:hypothetical protein AB0945_24865 [Streptomyces sp. NPDC005474]|uniref:hypothetical protein n=1 Tax=Streptomyces sp. NPDC005474 TaxID=3154878 RepID=UPI003451EE72